MSPRLRSFIDRRVTVTPGGCWEASGVGSRTGYQNVRVSPGGPKVRAHRFVYEELVGPIPEGLELDHLCRNTRCVNPEHLEPVTHAENMRRLRRRFCSRGHALTDGNVYTKYYPSGGIRGRNCRQCCLDRERNRKQKAREQREIEAAS